MISIVAIGKKHESWVEEGIERYEKRLRPPYDVQWVRLPHSTLDGDSARREESSRIVKRIGDGAYVVLLDERGKSVSSPDLSVIIGTAAASGKNIVIVIGGAYGVDDSVTERADTVLSLSRMVFPHQLVRLILAEQLYRAQTIASGGKYHHA